MSECYTCSLLPMEVTPGGVKRGVIVSQNLLSHTQGRRPHTEKSVIEELMVFQPGDWGLVSALGIQQSCVCIRKHAGKSCPNIYNDPAGICILQRFPKLLS